MEKRKKLLRFSARKRKKEVQLDLRFKKSSRLEGRITSAKLLVNNEKNNKVFLEKRVKKCQRNKEEQGFLARHWRKGVGTGRSKWRAATFEKGKTCV